MSGRHRASRQVPVIIKALIFSAAAGVAATIGVALARQPSLARDTQAAVTLPPTPTIVSPSTSVTVSAPAIQGPSLPPATDVAAMVAPTKVGLPLKPPPPPAPPPPPPPPPAAALKLSTTGFGGVKPFVAVVGHYLQNRFGTEILGVGARAISSDHPDGYALDVLVGTNRGLGDQIAQCVLDHRSSWRVSYVIWRQRINNGTGWRLMEDRGSVTANHYDHVHVSFEHGVLPLPVIGPGC